MSFLIPFLCLYQARIIALPNPPLHPGFHGNGNCLLLIELGCRRRVISFKQNRFKFGLQGDSMTMLSSTQGFYFS